MIEAQADRLRAKVEYDARTYDLRKKLRRVFKGDSGGAGSG